MAKGSVENKGSPPHMRGKASEGAFLSPWCGITPAHAGKSKRSNGKLEQRKDHPRTCGEKPSRQLTGARAMGSPPHMRGKERRFRQSQARQRITPAHAGKRQKRSRSIVSPAAIVLRFPSVCNRPAGSSGNPAERGVPPFLPAENAVPALPAYSSRF